MIGTRHSALGTRLNAPALALLGAAACAATAAAQNGSGRVEFERTGYRLTALGARVAVSAKLVDARRRAVPNAPIAYRVSNPTIAVVSNQGVVQSKRVGRTMVWAVSGTDSASALIVVDQWATTFSFSPPAVLFDAIGARAPLQVQLRDAAGNAIPDQGRRTTQCRSRDERVASLLTNGNVVSKAAGTTWVRCTDRGISDSVRVEVRQRPARVMIADKLAVGTKAVPDTFRLRARAFDSKGDSIAGARATWASLERGVVSVDPVTGLARAVGGGTTRIVAQVGDVTDTVSINVDGTPAVGLAADSTAAATSNQPTLVLDPLYPLVGDSAPVTFTAKDALGASIANAERDMAFTSSNDTIFRYIGNRRIVARATGTAFLIARLSVGGVVIAESTTVSPRARASGTGNAASAATERAFVRPVFNTDSMVRFNREQIQRQMKSIIDSGIGRPASGRVIAMEGIAGQATHSTRTTSVLEKRSGLVYGGTGSLAPFRWLVATGSFRTGTLVPKADDLLTEEMVLTEADAQLAVWPASWFGIGGSYLLRGESTELSTVAWNAIGASLMSRGKFVGGAVGTYAAVTIFPVAEFTGRPDKPALSFGGEAGLELRLGAISGALTYYVEKFTFAAEGTTSGEREDQFSALRLKLGLKLGR